MSDEIDDANDELQKQIEATLSNVNIEVPDNDTGTCIWCEDAPVKGTERWCSTECRDEHEHYARKL